MKTHPLLLCGLLAVSSAFAQIPDLTAGDPVPSDPTPLYINLGPTGLEGWMYRSGQQTTASRQILVTSVAAGSPAAGILAVNDVILGADGTGAAPVNFTSDARKSLAYAIADAEARDPATLSLLSWRSDGAGGGTTTTVTLTLQTLGAYSATAPYNCPKSATILERSLNYDLANASPDGFAFIALGMMAANDPNHPNNAARQALAQTEVRKLILSPAEINDALAGVVPTSTKVAWDVGHELIVLAEYYRKTGDAVVYDSLRARAHQAANGSSLFGTHGHQFTVPDANGNLNGTYNHGYGVMNNASITCFLGLVAAREAGLNEPIINAAIQRAESFYGSYSNRGVIPYSEHYPWNSTTDNGKSAQLAMCMSAIEGREVERDYFAKTAISSYGQRDSGHQGSWFNYIWSPLGAAAAGEEAAHAYFEQISWMLDLSRRWDGSFEYNQLHTSGGQGGDSYQSPKLLMSTVAQLTYALPHRQLFITGADHDSLEAIDATDAAEAAFASGYNASGRTTAELLGLLGHPHHYVRKLTATEIGNRTAEYAPLLPTLVSMANDPQGGNSRYGACLAMGQFSDGSSAASLIPLLTDLDPDVRYFAAEGFSQFDKATTKGFKVPLMNALVANSKPYLPLDPQDPFQWANTRLSEIVFAEALVDGIGGVDQNLLYSTIQAGANLNNAMSWGALKKIFKYFSKEDLEANAGIVLDMSSQVPLGNSVSAAGVKSEGTILLGRHKVAEGVPLSIPVYHESGDDVRTTILGVLEDYAGGCLTVNPDPEVIEFLQYVIQQHSSQRANAQAALAAIDADPNPVPLEPFKAITSATANPSIITLPRNWTALNVDSYDHADGDSIYTWRKLQGLGEVSFGLNGTAAAKNTTVMFDGTPGIYTLEVKMSDSRGLTEVYETVIVTVLDSAGSLPPNSPPTADPVSVTAAHGTPTPIQLLGSDPEGHPLVYTVTSNPLEGSLEGAGANWVYTPNYVFTGVDTFSYQVMDSDGRVASATVSITVGSATNVGVAVYEPFDYPVGPLNGVSGANEIGLAGTWSAHSSINVKSGSLGFSSLVTKGGSLNPPDPGVTTKTFGGKRGISTAALADAGLLDDGATLWLSASIGGGHDGWTNDVALAFANNQFNSSGGNYSILNEGADLGRGVGVYFRQWRAVAAMYRDPSTGSNKSPIVEGTQEANNPKTGNGSYQFVVAKMTWGATTDTIELYIPQSDMSLGDPCSYLTVNVDQSKFDTLTFTRQNDYHLDEVRMGATYQSVLQGTVPMTADTQAPVPDPMTFEIGARMSSPDSISMKASSAFDSLGVEYYFTCTAGGGNDSGWQDSPSYTDTGLTPGITYSYTVKARDKSQAANETAPSAASSATIPVQTSVPMIVGVPQAAAEQAIVDAYLGVGSISTEHNASFPVPGTVISATPSAGSAAAYGTSVGLLVSLGYPSISSTDFVDDRGGAPIHVGNPVTYTLTFTLNMDAATIDASDFSNAGTSTISIGAITEESPGVFTVEVTPTSAGTLQLQILAGASLADTVGHLLDTSSAIADDTTLTIIPPNVAPIWNADPFNEVNATAASNYSSSLADKASDSNGDALTFTKVSGPAWLQVAADGTLSGIPSYSDAGVNSFTVSASDGHAAPVNATLNIHVTTSGIPGSVTVVNTGSKVATSTKSTSLSFNAGATADKLVVVVSSEKSSGGTPVVTYNGVPMTAVSLGTGRAAGIWYLDNPYAGGAANITVDFTSYTTVNGIGMAVVSLNDTAPGYDVTYTNASNTLSLTASIDNSVAVVGFGANGGGTTNPNAPLTKLYGASNIGSAAGAAGYHTIATAGSNTYSFTSSNTTEPAIVGAIFGPLITPIDQPPFFNSAPIVDVDATEDAAYSSTLADDATDANGDSLTFAKVSGPAWLGVAPDGSLSGTPTNADVGPNSFTVSVTDGNNPAVEATLSIEVINTNDAPVFAANPFTAGDAPEDQAYADSISGVASDEDNDELTYELVSGPAWLTLAPNGALSGTPTNDDVGLNSFTVSVSDGTAPEVEATLEIVVLNTNDAPVFAADPIAGAAASEDASYTGTIAGSASGDDSDPLSYAKVSGPAWLSIAPDGTLSGIPTNGDVGANAFTVSVSDGIALPLNATLSITVVNTNDAPVAVNLAYATDEDTADAVALTAGDIDGDALGYAVVTGPANGVLSGTAPNLTYTPNSDYHGADSFTFKANDGTVDSNTATVSIVVNAVNDAPVFANHPIAGADATAGAPYSGTIADSATDTDGDVLTYGKVSGPAWLGVAADGTISGTPTNADVGPNAFTVSVSDGFATAVEATLNITVTSRSKLLRTTLTAVGNDSWQTVDLGQSYNSAVIVATPVLPNHTHPPVVTRLRNVSGSNFDIMIQRVDGQTGAVAVDVQIVVVEEGVYTLAEDGVTMEAVKYISTTTAQNNSWVAESRGYLNTYTNPVVVGQVMSANDTNWSVFWCQGSSRSTPPSASSLSTGKHVGEDPNAFRSNETIGYIVIESGAGSVDGINLVAGLGADTIQGPGDSASGYTYSLSGLSSASTAAISLAAMDGGDGGFAVLSGANPVTPNSITLWADEDQLTDTERKHTTEQVGFIVLE